MLKRAREKKSTTFLKKSDYEFGRFSSAQIANAIFVRELYALHSRYAPQSSSNYWGDDRVVLFRIERNQRAVNALKAPLGG